MTFHLRNISHSDIKKKKNSSSPYLEKAVSFKGGQLKKKERKKKKNQRWWLVDILIDIKLYRFEISFKDFERLVCPMLHPVIYFKTENHSNCKRKHGFRSG